MGRMLTHLTGRLLPVIAAQVAARGAGLPRRRRVPSGSTAHPKRFEVYQRRGVVRPRGPRQELPLRRGLTEAKISRRPRWAGGAKRPIRAAIKKDEPPGSSAPGFRVRSDQAGFR